MAVQLEVIFDSSKHEVEIKTEHIDAVKQLLNANKAILSHSKSILLELENNKLCSNGYMNVSGTTKVLRVFFETLSPYLSNHSMAIDIVDSDTKTGLLLKYKSGKVEKSEEYAL